MQPNNTPITIPPSLYTFAGSTAAVRQNDLNSTAEDKDAALSAAERLCAISASLLDVVVQADGRESLTIAAETKFKPVVWALQGLMRSSLQAVLLDTLWAVNNSYVAVADRATRDYTGLDPALWLCSVGEPGSIG